jgi:hypothetical protein
MDMLYKVAKLMNGHTYTTHELETRGADEQECDALAKRHCQRCSTEPGIVAAVVIERTILATYK